jgi:hypothetical protein
MHLSKLMEHDLAGDNMLDEDEVVFRLGSF